MSIWFPIQDSSTYIQVLLNSYSAFSITSLLLNLAIRSSLPTLKGQSTNRITWRTCGHTRDWACFQAEMDLWWGLRTCVWKFPNDADKVLGTHSIMWSGVFHSSILIVQINLSSRELNWLDFKLINIHSVPTPSIISTLLSCSDSYISSDIFILLTPNTLKH